MPAADAAGGLHCPRLALLAEKQLRFLRWWAQPAAEREEELKIETSGELMVVNSKAITEYALAVIGKDEPAQRHGPKKTTNWKGKVGAMRHAAALALSLLGEASSSPGAGASAQT